MFYLFPFFLGVEGDGLQKINDRINGLVEGISVVFIQEFYQYFFKLMNIRCEDAVEVLPVCLYNMT